MGGDIKSGTRGNEEWEIKSLPSPCLKCRIQGKTGSVRESKMLKPVRRSPIPESSFQFPFWIVYVFFFKSHWTKQT